MNHNNFPNLHHLLVKSANMVKVIKSSQIVFIQADDNYSKVFLEDQCEFLLCKTLGDLEGEINNGFFFRCHRTFLVNVLFVKEIYQGDQLCIILKNGRKIPLARRRYNNFRKFLTRNELTTVYPKK